GWGPGNIVVGNSVYSLGIVRGITSGLRTLAGGEVESITHLISDGRHAAIQRLEQEATSEGAHGLTGVVSELRSMGSLTEHLALARLEREAIERGCNAVVDITTRIFPFGPGVREMLMVGTGSFNPVLGKAGSLGSDLAGDEFGPATHPPAPGQVARPVTSEL